jgi:hypothetical protein
VDAAIKGAASVGKVTSAGTGSPNLLLYNVFGGSQPPSGFNLTANGYKVRGFQTVDLSWSGATTAVDIYRNNVPFVTGGVNDGAHTDNVGVKGGGASYTYKVCHTGSTTTCSNNVTVNF